jgi:hypothetical protein
VAIAPDSPTTGGSTPDPVEAPAATDSAIVASDSRTVESAMPEPAEAAVDADLPAAAAGESIAVANAESGTDPETETPASREESPLA